MKSVACFWWLPVLILLGHVLKHAPFISHPKTKIECICNEIFFCISIYMKYYICIYYLGSLLLIQVMMQDFLESYLVIIGSIQIRHINLPKLLTYIIFLELRLTKQPKILFICFLLHILEKYLDFEISSWLKMYWPNTE